MNLEQLSAFVRLLAPITGMRLNTVFRRAAFEGKSYYLSTEMLDSPF